MAQIDENAILELGKSPIPGPQPCGADVADDTDYIFVDVEIAKLDRIESDDPDWHSIVRSATNLLKSKSKDIDIAAALGIGLYQIHGYGGLAAWLGMTSELVRSFWDGLFPSRPRRRKAAIESVTDKFGEGGWFSENPPKAEGDFDALDLCAARIVELETLLNEKLPEDGPDFKKFIRRLTEQCALRPKSAAEPAAAVASQPSAGGGGVVAGEINDARGAVSAVMKAAAFLRQTDASDPLPYAFIRAIKWSKIDLPTSDSSKYQIDPPESSTLETLQHQYGKQLWENLLKNAEAAFRTADPLWLDLQRYVCSALRGMGPSYEKAYEVVVTETAGLVRRLGEGLFDLKFKTGQPLCDGETRMWIEAECASGDSDSGGSRASEANGKLLEARDKARKFVASGKLKEGLVELQSGLAGATQRRDRFLWRLQIAQLCFDAQRLQLASPLLEECHEDVQRHGIDEWEPSLAVYVAETLYRCRKSLVSAEKSPSPAAIEKVKDSFAWLCQLDPVAALAVEPSAT